MPSYGMTPYDLVQQIYYNFEGVRLDFRPTDDKYKEALMAVNYVLEEFQSQEDWTPLRERLVLGDTSDLGCSGGQIPEYSLPPFVYKPSTMHGDSVRLYRRTGRCCDCSCCGNCLDERHFIEAPWVTAGSVNQRRSKSFNRHSGIHMPDQNLYATWLGGIVTFNRPLYPREKNRIAVTDIQRRLMPLHICNDNCELDDNGVCKSIEKRVLMEIPDPQYIVLKAAAIHGQNSPPAQAVVMDLNDRAQKLLSAMRQNDAASTEPELVEWDVPGFIRVV